MPELPDLHIYAKNLRRRILEKRIVKAEVFNRAKVGCTREAFKQMMVGTSITAIEREGKELFFILSDGQSFGVHLMLSGCFTLSPSWLDIHGINRKVIAMEFEDGQALTVSDMRGLCKVTPNPRPGTAPDALSDAFSWAYFQKVAAKNAHIGIKALLINQRIVRGIGNAYVDEILWRANVSPKSITGAIPEADLLAIYDAIGWVMRDAIENLERIAPDAISGEERSFLRVHQPRKKVTPDGDAILCEDVDQKRTYFTAKQRLFIL